MSREPVRSEGAGEAAGRRRAEPRAAVVEQLELLADEAEALGPLLGTMPEEFIHGRPFDGTPTIGEMLLEIARLDRTERRADVLLFDGGVGAASDEGEYAEPGGGAPAPLDDILQRLAGSRRELVEVVRGVSDGAWEATGRVQGEATTLLAYLVDVTRRDASILRAIAERVYESRPARSPGFTSR